MGAKHLSYHGSCEYIGLAAQVGRSQHLSLEIETIYCQDKPLLPVLLNETNTEEQWTYQTPKQHIFKQFCLNYLQKYLILNNQLPVALTSPFKRMN